MPLQATSGAASYDAFGGGVPAVPQYIEEVFSTFLYTGNGSTQTITNGIDLSTKGGMVWIKSRSAATTNYLFDTSRGALNEVNSNTTDSQAAHANSLTAFNTTGFDLGSAAGINVNADTYASWTFRKQPKFFDVVTYTGDGTSPRAISHNLGSAPGCVIIKQTNAANDWCVWHTATGNDSSASLNLTNAFATFAQRIKSVTSTTFSVGNSSTVNDSGATYVAYLFAHDAGGFGLTGTDNVVSCGSFTTDGSGAYSVTLGYEPQFVLMKRTDSTGDWLLMDNMRGMPVGGNDAILRPNTSGAETQTFDCANPTATGFYESTGSLGASRTFIYIAIRRGPMRVPTSGTSVFTPVQSSSFTAGAVISGQSRVDMSWSKQKDAANSMRIFDRLRGSSTSTNLTLNPAATSSETNEAFWAMDQQNGVRITQTFTGTFNYINYFYTRAPSFFDEVCYTGTGSARTVSHNLGVAPELMIVKRRDTVEDWNVYNSTIGNTAYLRLNTTAASATAGGDALWGSTTPTSSVFTVKTSAGTNASAGTFVAYLFATAAGVSKVGSYTGTATTKQIDCGFTAGARFVLIKRTDSTGDWYVWDTARGIVSGNDPYLLLNSTAAEVTSTDYIDTYSAGFEISSTAPSAINASGGTFIFLAIA